MTKKTIEKVKYEVKENPDLMQWTLIYPSKKMEVHGFGSAKECELFYNLYPEGIGFETFPISWNRLGEDPTTPRKK